MRGYESAKAGGIFWFGVDDAASTVYVPIYSTITEVPNCFAESNGDMYTYSPTAAWWTFNIVANWAYTKYSAMMPDIKKVQTMWEDKFNAKVEDVDKTVANLSAKDAQAWLTRYSCVEAEKVTQAWKQLGIYLFTKYLDGQQRKEKNGKFLRNEYGLPESPNRVPYPTEFLQEIAPAVAHE